MKNTELKIPALRFPEFSGEWEEKRLGEIVSFLDGMRKPIKEADRSKIQGIYPYYGASGIIDYVNNYIFDDHLILLGEDGENILSRNLPLAFTVQGKIWVNNHAHVLKANDGYDTNFIALILENVSYVKYNTGTAQPKLNQEVCKRILLSSPPLPEQQKIADFLSAVDKRLQLLKDKKTKLEEYKRGVMQRIFSQELRFTRPDGSAYPDWEEKKLGELLIQHSERNKENKDIEVLSVSNKLGFIKQENQFENHRVASEDTSNYKIVKKGWFAYNPSRINVGSIAMLSDFLIGIVSPMYIVFELSSLLNSTYFGNLIKTHYYKYLIQIGCSGSVRESLNFSELEKMKIHLPHIDEQRQIADFLSAIDDKISLLNQQIASTEQYKKGLLQQMFV